MLFLVGITVVFAAVVLLIAWGVIRYTEWTMKRLIETQHRDGEFIVATGEPPPQWTERLRQRLGTNRGRAAAEQLGNREKRLCDRRIAALIRYFTNSPLVEDEDTRRQLLQQLEAARREWRQRDARAFLGPPPSSPFGSDHVW